MRNLTIVVLSAAICFLAVNSLVLAGDKEAWFDMENCGFCKHMAAEPEMLQATTWEHHDISNGLMSITTVPAEHLATFRKVNEKLEAIGKEMEQGKQVPMCTMCMAMGGLMMKGAAFEVVHFEHGDVWLMTSDNPEVVKEIHGWAEKTRTELAKMEGQEAKCDKKHGHGH